MAADFVIKKMKENYEAGGYGYGHAKQALFELICEFSGLLFGLIKRGLLFKLSFWDLSLNKLLAVVLLTRF